MKEPDVTSPANNGNAGIPTVNTAILRKEQTVPVGNAWKYAPARQARLQQDMQNPELMRRKEIYRKARGRDAKALVANWNIDWNLAGRPADFPDFPEWKSARKILREGI